MSTCSSGGKEVAISHNRTASAPDRHQHLQSSFAEALHCSRCCLLYTNSSPSPSTSPSTSPCNTTTPRHPQHLSPQALHLRRQLATLPLPPSLLSLCLRKFQVRQGVVRNTQQRHGGSAITGLQMKEEDWKKERDENENGVQNLCVDIGVP